MQRTKIEKAGDELVIVVPSDIELATGLYEGEEVEVIAYAGSILVRRQSTPSDARTTPPVQGL